VRTNSPRCTVRCGKLKVRLNVLHAFKVVGITKGNGLLGIGSITRWEIISQLTKVN
jgi:hypothetical protein